MKKFKTLLIDVAENQQIKGECNATIFINRGTSPCTINGLTLAAGATFSIEGNAGEIDVTTYKMEFDSNVALTRSVQVIRKIYE